MMARREVLETLVVAIAGAIGGTGCVLVTTVMLVGQEGMYLPWFLAAGPLLLASERLPVAVTGLVLAPLLYGVTAAALWNTGRSRWAAILATILYALFLAGPLLGITGHLWSHERPFDYSAELRKTESASRDLPASFAAMMAGLAGWNAFAWWRLSRFWCADERPPVVRWGTVGLAAMMFGLVVSHAAHVVPHCQVPVLLALGPTVFLEFVFPSPRSNWWFVLSAALVYGVQGFLLMAAQERQKLFWPAAIAFGAFAFGSIALFLFIMARRTNWLRSELTEATVALDQSPILFPAVMLALIAWQAFVVSSLWRSYFQSCGRERVRIER